MLRSLRLLALALVLLLAPAAQAGELKVYFFDIGQGDSALIVSPTGKTVLIDSGPPEGAASLRRRLSELLTGPIDLAILTHPHLDHLGGMEQALSVHGAQAFMDSGFNHPSPAYSSLLRYLEAHNIKVVNATQGRNIDMGGGAMLTLLGPPSPFFSGTRSDPNANSIVARLTFGNEHILFTGDAEEETEQMLIHGGDLQSDVLKVPHHGSRHSSTQPFLDAVKPRFAIISVGAGNDYGHPTRAALDRLEGMGAKIFRTDLDGEIRLVTDGKNLEVYPAKDAPTASVAAEPEPEPQAPEPKKSRGHMGKVVDVKKHDVERGFVASKNSKVFHKPSCNGAEHIKADNKISFATRQQALASGREPAKDCNP